MSALLQEPTLFDAFTRAADRRQLGMAIRVVAVLTALFVAAVPFAAVPMRVMAFVPVYRMLIVNDLITAVFMFGMAHVSRSRALLALATGYVFTGFAATAHLLTFPGLFSPTGLFGAGEQSTVWLYIFWHRGFPIFVIAYVVTGHRSSLNKAASWLTIVGCTVGTFVVVCALATLRRQVKGGCRRS
jgi:hypothetical protein